MTEKWHEYDTYNIGIQKHNKCKEKVRQNTLRTSTACDNLMLQKLRYI